MSQSDYSDFVHTGPRTLAGRYLRLFWQPVYLGRELPPGRAVPIRIMREDFTLYRGEGGVPHVVVFRCAHRGTQLSVGSIEGDCIRCFYHGWKYDASGQCVEQPAEDPTFAAKVKIRSYPAKEYLGMIFAYLGDGEPPQLPRYSHLEGEGVILADSSVRPFNYFQNLENTVDLVHLAVVHLGDRGVPELLTVSAEESEWGITARVPATKGSFRTDQVGMPNILNFAVQLDERQGGLIDQQGWKVPIDDESFHQFSVRYAHVTGEAARLYRERQSASMTSSHADVSQLGKAILRGEAHISDFRGHPQEINLQDFVTQGGQGVVADRKHERLGRSDEGVILLRKIWQRELKALAEGQPLKQWRRPPELRATAISAARVLIDLS